MDTAKSRRQLISELEELRQKVAALQEVAGARYTDSYGRRSETRHRLALRTASIGLWDHDVETGEIFLSREWKQQIGLLDREVEDPEREWQDRLHGEDRERVLDAWQSFVDGDTPEFLVEYRLRHEDGLYRWFLSRGEVLRNHRKQPTRLLRTSLDITERKQAEEKIHFQTLLLDRTRESVVATDVEGRVVYWNRGAERLYRYTAAEVLGQPLDMVFTGTFGVPEGMGSTSGSALASGEASWSGEHLRRRKDGSTFWAETYVSLVRDENDRVVGLVGIDHDITERRRAAHLLRESEGRFRQLVSHIPEVFWIATADGNDILYLSPSFEMITGRSCNSLYSKPRAFLELVAEEDRPQVLAAMKALSSGSSEEIECRIVRDDGEERWLRSRGFPVRDDTGEVFRIAGVTEDISERRRVEEKVRFLSLITEQVTDSVIATDLEFRIIYGNRAFTALYGWTAEELRGKTPEVLNAEPMAPEIQEEIYETVARGRTWRGELQNRRKDGRVFSCEIMVFPLVDEQGQIFAHGGIQRDVTTQKRAADERLQLERQLQHAQKLESLGVLAGGIAHDFNNLLMGVLGNADLALIKLPASSPARDLLEAIKRAASRASELSSQMLAYSGRGKFVVELVNLSAVVREMSHLLEASLSKKTVLRLQLAENLPAVEADVTQLSQVVLNLITNAAEAIGEEGGIVSITTRVVECDREMLSRTYVNDHLPGGTYVALEVSDTGCGMDPETKARIFDPFFTTKLTGRGIGLAATLGIVRGHESAIEVDSEPEVGTRVRVLIPVSDRDEPVEVIPAPPPPETKEWRGSGTVLLVDDEEVVRTAAGYMLAELGFDLLVAGDGRTAVEVFRQHQDRIALVLLDMQMPHMNGAEAFAEIRRISQSVKVVLSSGYSEEEATFRFAGKGLDGFIQKPYHLAKLRTKLREVLG